MALEIERKFLVISDNWQRLGTPEVVRQGYLSRDIERTVRVRIKGDKAFLTIKGRNEGAVRTEFEYAIPTDEGAVLLDTLALKPLIEKTRTKVAYAGKIWEIDRFFGETKVWFSLKWNSPRKTRPCNCRPGSDKKSHI